MFPWILPLMLQWECMFVVLQLVFPSLTCDLLTSCSTLINFVFTVSHDSHSLLLKLVRYLAFLLVLPLLWLLLWLTLVDMLQNCYVHWMILLSSFLILNPLPTSLMLPFRLLKMWTFLWLLWTVLTRHFSAIPVVDFGNHFHASSCTWHFDDGMIDRFTSSSLDAIPVLAAA